MSNHDELFPDRKTVMFGDIELPLSHKFRPRDLPPITEAEIVAYCTQGPKQPRPTITAWEGADLDAYWFDNGVWRHCQTGAEWVMVSLDEAQGRINAAQGYVCREIDERALESAVAEAIGVPALMAAAE